MKNFDNQCILRKLLIAVISSSALLFFSMAAATETTAPENPAAAENRPGPIGVSVSGASAGITTDYFEQAVIDAIIASGIFSAIDNSEKTEIIMPMIRADGTFSNNDISDLTPYFLNIRVVKVNTPSFSIRMTVGMNAVWTLYRTADKAELLHENIYSTYTGGGFEGGWHGANRVRVAMQGAARDSIRIGIGMLGSLDFSQVENQTEQPESESSALAEQARPGQ
ncbi:MAG: hypothetical protein CL797_02245 [Chromatiales bacterium]|nr:hypothetical protein [Chromatiales bacterium]